jgi:two-component system sensor histidine kinase BaeS
VKKPCRSGPHAIFTTGCDDEPVMRTPRGLLGRTIIASVLVAAVAVVATALLTLNVTQDNLAHQRTQREAAESDISRDVLEFGLTHPTWTGLGTVLRARAAKDTTLVLTDPDGARLASSGPDAVTAADPSAAPNPLGTVVSAMAATVPHDRRSLSLPAVLLAATKAGAGLRALARSNSQLAICAHDDADITTFQRDGNVYTAVVMISDCKPPAGAGSTGSVVGLVRLQDSLAFAEHSCLTRRGVPSVLARLAGSAGASPYLFTVSLPGRTSAAATAWHDCSTAALTRLVGPVVAPGALLYITGSTTSARGIVDRIGRLRILAAVGVVLLVVVGASLLASRQVLSPVRRLTAATRAMAGGELSTRVDAAGGGEVAELGHSFNEMAGALAGAEEQRRRMVDDIAHELRSPLANIRGYLEAGQDGVLDRNDAWTASLLEETALLQHVVDDIAVLAMADAGRLRVVRDAGDLAATVDLAIAAAATAAAARNVRIERTGDETDVPHDRLRMRQVVGNLLSNAIRHAPAGSAVTVTVDRSTIEVRDRGAGIDPENVAHVFERFYRADPSRSRDTGGSGLGLAIVTQLVEAHGGTVSAGNHPDGGAVFTVVLPSS